MAGTSMKYSNIHVVREARMSRAWSFWLMLV